MKSSISYIFDARHMASKMGARSATNSTTNLTVSPASVQKTNAFEGFEHSLFTFKIMLLVLLAVDIFFIGLFVPSNRVKYLPPPYTQLITGHVDFTSINCLLLYGYLALLLVGIGGILSNAPRLLVPLYLIWVFTLLMTVLLLLWSTWEYFYCSWVIHFHPEAVAVCHWTFIDSYADIAVYTMILGLKLSQVFLAHIVVHLLYKAIRIQSFDARKHGADSDDEDVMVVFERLAGIGTSGKVRDAAIA